MTKADLVERVASEADMTKKDAEQLVEIVFDSIINSLNSGEKIELRGFGSFRVRERNSRKAAIRKRVLRSISRRSASPISSRVKS
jgi:integration host factor subunit beta